MIDGLVLPIQRRLLGRPAQWLVGKHVHADQITVAGFVIGLIGVLVLANGHYLAALALILLNRVADGLDGTVARLTRPTDRGAFLDTAFDFSFYALVPMGFAVADSQSNALPAAVLITAFVGSGSSFLAFAVIAAKRGLTSTRYQSKGLYYLGGLTEGGETIAFFVAVHLVPSSFSMLAYAFAGACAVTTVTRWLTGWRAFSGNASGG